MFGKEADADKTEPRLEEPETLTTRTRLSGLNSKSIISKLRDFRIFSKLTFQFSHLQNSNLFLPTRLLQYENAYKCLQSVYKHKVVTEHDPYACMCISMYTCVHRHLTYHIHICICIMCV